jgi:MutS domain V
MNEAANNPLAEAQRRLAEREKTVSLLQRRHRSIGNVRLVVFLLFIALCWLYVRTSSFSPFWLIATISLFVALVLVHQKVLKQAGQVERGAAMYRRSVARMEDNWIGSGETGNDFRQASHLYCDDLNILGDGSLFQLLCVARSRMGQECLADWLLHQSVLPTVTERQAAAAELRSKLDLRERLATAGDADRIAADHRKLQSWAQASIDLNYRGWWPLASVFGLLAVVSFIYATVTFFIRGSAFWSPFILILVLNGILMFRFRHGLETIFRGLDSACHNLEAIAELVRLLENEKFESLLLTQLQSRFSDGNLSASEGIARLGSLCELENSRLNIVLRALDLPLLYSLQVGFALQRWRNKYAGHVASWTDALGQIEALLSLATFSYEHPGDTFPEFNGSNVSLGLEAESIGHPLIPSSVCVRNNVRLGGDQQIVMISGSNMSGKSTLLRAIGINAVLAMAGSTVRASHMLLSAVNVGASINISDSLQKGVSHFYAEISRIRAVVDLAGQGPLLFLFDEVLQGTNSHDRRVGAGGVVSTLLKRNAIGLITTHDLSLTELEKIFPRHVTNMHFQEKLEAGKLSFDYKLRAGVVTTSNGVELMRSIGLDV